VEYVANDHLLELTARASAHLAELTAGRYELSLDDEAAFVVRDHDLGGVSRPVSGLSGGESFLTALALALSLSSLVQARSSRPLGFFFLDEGFGTLDPEALDRVMTAIEGLRSEDRVIGLISHVPEVRDRVPRYLSVTRVVGGASRVQLVDG
jgi:exonuclease SbcC